MSALSSIRRFRSVLALAIAFAAISGSTAVAAPSFEVSLKNAEGSDVQAVYVEATTGQFRLSFGAGGPGISETGDIPAGATAAQVEAALNALTNVSAGGGSVSVAIPGADSNGTNPYLVAFDGGPLALKLQPLMKAMGGTVPLGASPLGGGPAMAYVTTWIPGGISRSDERTDYTVSVRNIASASPGVGDELFCNGIESSTGPSKNWNPGAPGDPTHPAYTFEWRRNGIPIPAAAGQTYVVAASDEGAVLQCLVTGTNATSAAKYASQPGMVVSPQPAVTPPAPSDRINAGSRPAVLDVGGASRTGLEKGVCHPPANWEGSPTYTFQWLRNGEPIGAGEAETAEYQPVAADEGKILQCQVVGTNAGGSLVGISNNSQVGTVASQAILAVAQNPAVEFASASVGTVTVEVTVPDGLGSFVYGPGTGGSGWTCTAQAATGLEPAKAVCTRSDSLAPGASYPLLNVAIGLGADAPSPFRVEAVVSGGGAVAPATAASEFAFDPFREFGFIPGRFVARALGSDGKDYTQAGGHPALAVTSVSLNRVRSLVDKGAAYDRYKPVAAARDVIGDVPPGFIGNPQAVPDLCPSTSDMKTGNCPPASVVGEAALRTKGLGNGAFGSQFARYPLYAIQPESGVPAEFALVNVDTGGVYVLQPKLRSEEGYAISIESRGVLENPPILDLRVTLCGYGSNIVPLGLAFGFRSCKQKGDPGAYAQPFLTTQTECASSGPVTKLHADSWANRGVFKTAEAVAPKMTGCDLVPFEPGMSLQPSTKQAESASGLDVDLSFPTEGLESPDGISQAHLKRATVTLPPGMSVNPASADGLAACTQAQLGLVNGVPNDEPVQCPDASKIGTVELKTPILEETLTGNVYLAKQGENPFGTLLGLYVVAESKERGVLIKIPGKVELKGNGQVVSTFDDNPQAPFASLKLNFKSGAGAPLMTPQRCGTYQITSELTPWSAADPDNPTPAETATRSSAFAIDSGPGGGPCPNGALLPTLNAGLANANAGSSSPFVVNLSRNDGTQRFNGLSMTLPPGLTASLRGVSSCSDAVLSSIPTAEGTGAAEIANPSCPAASRLGSVSVGAGAGKPFYVDTGKVYLAGPYKGAPVSLAVVIPAVAGPFDLGNVVVRNAAYVNPKTAQITVKSDPLPTALHNLPVDVRDIRISIDRPNFMRAPTNCEVMAIDALVSGEEGGSAPVSNRFQVGECGALGFSPSLKLELRGGTKRNKYQQVTATLEARPGDANIAGASVRFPRSIFLAQNHIRTVCTRVQFAADSCPPGSIYGEAEAETPLLDQPLKGPVYLRSSDNPLPDLVVALRGPDIQPIEVELAARTDSKNRGIRNTFDFVPDAPVSKFTLRMRGGKKSLLVSSRDLCLRKERAIVKMRGQNGMVRDFRPVVKVKCKKKKQQKQKKKQAQRGKKSR
ncbi:MAG TPA: hypothetical protein VD761_10310 [Solirubrobacterales bacterium]|nr:hypothetical protein [Solirubrobacterales bacterium]